MQRGAASSEMPFNGSSGEAIGLRHTAMRLSRPLGRGQLASRQHPQHSTLLSTVKCRTRGVAVPRLRPAAHRARFSLLQHHACAVHTVTFRWRPGRARNRKRSKQKCLPAAPSDLILRSGCSALWLRWMHRHGASGNAACRLTGAGLWHLGPHSVRTS